MKIRTLVVPGAFCVLLIWGNASAQFSAVKFEHLSVEQGLSQATCGSIAQDPMGFLWFGTQDGLNRYDGYSFKTYRTMQRPDNGLSNNFVYRLLVDKKGNLWAGTRFGLNLYDRHNDKFISFIHTPSDSGSLNSNNILSLFEDASGGIWVGTNEGANRFRWEDSTFSRYAFLSGKRINSIVEDKNGNLWISTDKNGLFQFDVKRETVVHYTNDPKKPSSISGNEIGAMATDSRGRIWMGVYGRGIDMLDPAKEEFIHYPAKENSPGLATSDIESLCFCNDSILAIGTYGKGLQLLNCIRGTFVTYTNIPGDPASIASNTVYAFFKDNTGALWIGTAAGGVNKYDPHKKKFYSFQNNPNNANSLNNNYVICALVDLNSNIWIGTREGGINVYLRRTGTFKVYKHDPSKPGSILGNLVTALYQDSHGNIWAGTTEGLCRYMLQTDDFAHYRHDKNNSSSISANSITSICEDAQGNLLVGTMGGGLNKLNFATGKFTAWRYNSKDTSSLSDDVVFPVHKVKSGLIWVGTPMNGLNCYDPATGKFKRFLYHPNDKTGISSNGVYASFEDHSGTMWFGTPNGLNRYNGDGTFTAYTTNDGLSNNTINGILEDSRGYLWLSTNKGLSRFDPKLGTAVNYFADDGLPGDEFNTGMPWKDRNGEMYFPHVEGLVFFHPESISVNTFKPPVIFTEFQIFYSPAPLNKDISELKSVALNFDENIFSFSFSALNYQQPGKNQYMYKLEGLNKNWIKLGNKHSVTFTHLDPGEYTLLVKGSNNDGVWNETPASMQIVILPPWWGTWWFRAIVGMFFLTVGPAVFFIRVRQLKREKEQQVEFSRRLIESQEAERQRIASELHDSLGQNLLVVKNRAVLGLQSTAGNKAAEDHFENISSLVSETLKETRFIAHNLRPYQLDSLGLTEAIRSVTRKISESTTVNISTAVDEIDGLLPKDSEIIVFRIAQECFNNILRHSKATEAELKVQRMAEGMVMTIRDNGKGMDETTLRQKGFGLKGIEERVKILNGRFSIISEPGKGTIITVVLPL